MQTRCVEWFLTVADAEAARERIDPEQNVSRSGRDDCVPLRAQQVSGLDVEASAGARLHTTAG